MKRFKEFLVNLQEAKRNSHIMYHVTDKSHDASIAKHGLKSDHDYILHGTGEDKPGVNLQNHELNYVYGKHENLTIHHVDTSKLKHLKKTKFDKDWHRYHGDIPKHAIVKSEPYHENL